MDINPSKLYLMPLSMGPMESWYPAAGHGSLYRERETVAMQYESEPDAIAALLPECYKPVNEATVTAAFAYCNGVSFMAGGGYRIATIMAGVQFDGERDHQVGNYPLVMFEDDTLPILLGRERLGIHKTYGDVSSIRSLDNGHVRCDVSLWGHPIFGMELGPLERQDESVCAAASAKASAMPLLGYKYIPSTEGPADAAYPISTPGEVTIQQLSLGKTGELYFGDPDSADIPFINRLVAALTALPVKQVLAVSRSRDSFVLRTDLIHRLH